MQSSHNVSVAFDDLNLIGLPGLDPVTRLAERAGLGDLVTEHLTLTAAGSANAHLKIPALIGGMVAGADSIDDMDLLRHGGMDRLFTGVRAPSTLGTFLRAFTFGHVRQLDAIASRLLVGLTRQAPVLPGIGQVAHVDIDDTMKATYGYANSPARCALCGRGPQGCRVWLQQGQGPQRVDRDHLHPARHPRGRRHEAAPRADQLRPRPGPPGIRRAGHGHPARRNRTGDPARGQRLLQPRRDRRRDPRRRAVFHHRPVQQTLVSGDREHRRGRVDPDPRPERDLGRGRAAPDLRRGGRRDRTHGVHVPAQGPAGDRAVDRAARQTLEPGLGARGARTRCSPPTGTTPC